MEDLQRTRLRITNVRLIVLIVLASVPIVLYVVAGTYAVWKTGLLSWLWWILPVCWLATWIVAKVWKSPKSRDARKPDADHWTPRDQAAAEIVLQYQQRVDSHSPAQLTDMHFYLNQLQSLAADLATHYHPAAADPFSSLTIPELAAAIRLVADDLEQLALHSLPGSRLLTVKQWKSLRDAPKWFNRIRNSVWAGSILINPLNIARYGASRATIDKVSTGIQSEILAAIYLRFIRQSGFYLIEMNSGRLRGGADAYRRTFDKRAEEPSKVIKGDASSSAQTGDIDNLQTDQNRDRKKNKSKGGAIDHRAESVTIGLIGQVSSGKSSLINALTGRADAAIDILPETRQVQRLQFTLSETDSQLTLLDSPGYAEAGAEKAQLREIEFALNESDVVLLVLDAHSPARSADVETLTKLSKVYTQNPRLKPPPVIAVLTHVDLLSPVMEWSPPYDLANPTGVKDESIAGAIAYANELFGEAIVAAVAVCTVDDSQRRWGITENLVPVLLNQLNEGKSVSILAAFEKFLDRDKVKTLLKQVAKSGKQIVSMWLKERLR